MRLPGLSITVSIFYEKSEPEIQRIGRGHRNGCDGLGRLERGGPVDVAAGDQLARLLRALNDHALRRGVLGDVERGVEHRLVVDGARGFDAARRRHDDRRTRVVDAGRQLVGREPAEHHRVHGAQSRARQHRDDGLGDHRHVDHHAVALADAEVAQHAGEPRGLVEQFA